MKWEEFQVKNQITVTTGKTKTVDQPLVEDDDDDCVKVFSELFNRLSKKATPIFKSIPVIELSPNELLKYESENIGVHSENVKLSYCRIQWIYNKN